MSWSRLNELAAELRAIADARAKALSFRNPAGTQTRDSALDALADFAQAVVEAIGDLDGR